LIGKTLGHYKIVSKLGEGGMGQVFGAQDTRLNRAVAIKVLPAEFAHDVERLARFRREARLLASLNHTNIAAMYGLEEIDDQAFLVMELVEGEDLSARLARGAFALEDALDYARQFAEGLEAAHEKSIVHRDLKPANLIINREDQLKILDFGLARAYLGDAGDDDNLENSPTITTALTGHATILGTAAYMSPEQARGRKVDQRSDIWSFGAILFEMLTGRRLFQGETISDTLAAVLRADVPWEDLPAGTPHAVRRLLERCLERDARRRLRDIGEARVRLERWRDDPQSMHESYGSSPAMAPAAGRGPVLAWAVAGVSLLLSAFLGWRSMSLSNSAPRNFDLELGILKPEELTDAGNTVVLSPDGRWISWTTPEGLWIRELSTPEPRLLYRTQDIRSTCFSPDSQWLAIAGGGLLQRINIGGGTPSTICDIPLSRGITWVDATTIVYSPGISNGLKQVDLTTGQTQDLTSIDEENNERSHRWPTTVPGRRAILFECQFLGKDYDESDIRYLSLDGGSQKTVYRGGAAPVATRYDQLLFVRENTLFAARFDGKTGKASGLPVPVRENVLSSVGNQEEDDGSAQYSIDSEGSLLYLDTGGARNRSNRLAWFEIESGKVTAFGPSGIHRRISLSPNRKLIVFSRLRDGNLNLYVHELESGRENTLSFRESAEYMGAWSPDSRLFYWAQSADAADRFEIWRRPVDGSSPAEFVVAAPVQAGIWPAHLSEDGRYLASIAFMGGNLRDILIVDLENPDAGFTSFAVNEKEQNDFQWFSPGIVMYREGGPDAGSILIRRFPDDGALWSFPELDSGYWRAAPTSSRDAVVAVGPTGIFRLPISVEQNSVQLGNMETLHTWTFEESGRIVPNAVIPVDDRLLCLYTDETAGNITPSKLVLVSGWQQAIDARLE